MPRPSDLRSRTLIAIAVLVLIAGVGCVPIDSVRGPQPSSPEPRPTATSAPSPTVFDPAKELALTPRPRLIYWRAPCPAESCERQTTPMVDEGKRFATNNYYVGFDGTWAWSLFAGWTLADGIGTFRLDRKDGFREITIAQTAGVPTLIAVSADEALFVTSTGRRGVFDLHTLKVAFSN